MKNILIKTLIILLLGNVAQAQMVVIDNQVLMAINTENKLAAKRAYKEDMDRRIRAGAAANRLRELVELKNKGTLSLDALTGNLGLSSHMREAFVKMLSDYESLSVALPSRRVGSGMMDNKNAADVKVLLKQVFSDRDDRNNAAYEPLRRKYYSDSLESALQLSEVVINTSKEELDRINIMSETADSNDELKAAMDVNNALLVQIATNLNQQNQLLAHLVRIQASENFRGVYSSASKLNETHADQVRKSISQPKVKIFNSKSENPYRKKSSSVVEKFFGGK